MFRRSPQLSADVEIVPVQLPGREERLSDPPASSLLALCEQLRGELRSRLAGPCGFFGYSLGGWVAFELARALQSEGHSIVQLTVAACRAPHLTHDQPPIHGWEDKQFLDAVQSRYGGIPREVAANADLLRFVLPTMRADFRCLEEYVYQTGPPLECPILALGGHEDSSVTGAQLLAWSRHTTGRFSLKFFSGGHFFIRQQYAQVLTVVTRQLEQSRNRMES